MNSTPHYPESRDFVSTASYPVALLLWLVDWNENVREAKSSVVQTARASWTQKRAPEEPGTGSQPEQETLSAVLTSWHSEWLTSPRICTGTLTPNKTLRGDDPYWTFQMDFCWKRRGGWDTMEKHSLCRATITLCFCVFSVHERDNYFLS